MNVTEILLTVLKQTWWLLPCALCSALVTSSRFKGYYGELFIRLLLRFTLDKRTWHRLHNVTISTFDGTTQIDHILLSPFGIFVIETKNMRGWIFGSADQASWTQVIFHHSNKFQNPLRQNFKHQKALADLLEISAEQIQSVIVFVGASTFKTPLPENVTYCLGAIRYIRTFTDLIYTDAEVRELLDKLLQRKRPPTFATHQEHVRNLQKRGDINASRLCPKCGHSLVVRTAKSGAKAGGQFWGCSAFPKCRLMQEVG